MSKSQKLYRITRRQGWGSRGHKIVWPLLQTIYLKLVTNFFV